MKDTTILHDLRRYRGQIWNVDKVVRDYSFGQKNSPWNSGVSVSDESWIDEFVYQGFHAKGKNFLKALNGRFSIAKLDQKRRCLFLTRDWIGEMPFYYMATPSGIYVANTIADLKIATGNEYTYEYVRAFPQSYHQEIDLKDVDPGCVSITMRPEKPSLFINFEDIITSIVEEKYRHSAFKEDSIREYFLDSIKNRTVNYGNQVHAVLLSGGLDSFSIAIGLNAISIPFEAYTISVDENSYDVSMAKKISKKLGVKHHVVTISYEEVISTFEKAILVSECYHLFNIYCAVGMYLLGKKMSSCGIRSAFCGEALNEALGDYKDWKVIDPLTGKLTILQHIDDRRLQRLNARKISVWGQLSDKGKYNRQLGTGLAKHANSRMIKPFNHFGITLECPYYDIKLLAYLVSIQSDFLKKIGSKQGLIARVFKPDLQKLGINQPFLKKFKKIRLQDASSGGGDGITSILLKAGCDQKKAIEIFNKHFGANLDIDLNARRLLYTYGGQH